MYDATTTICAFTHIYLRVCSPSVHTVNVQHLNILC